MAVKYGIIKGVARRQATTKEQRHGDRLKQNSENRLSRRMLISLRCNDYCEALKLNWQVSSLNLIRLVVEVWPMWPLVASSSIFSFKWIRKLKGT